jgi:ribosomal protein S9
MVWLAEHGYLNFDDNIRQGGGGIQGQYCPVAACNARGLEYHTAEMCALPVGPPAYRRALSP